MGARRILRAWDRKPGPGSQINWNHPLAKGLRYFVLLDRYGYTRNLAARAFSFASDSGFSVNESYVSTVQANGQGQYTLEKPDWIGSYAISFRKVAGTVPWMFASDTVWDGIYTDGTDAVLTSNSGFGGAVTPVGETFGGFKRFAFSIPAANNFRCVSGTGAVATDTSAALPVGAMTKLVLGSDYGGTENGSTSDFEYFAVWDTPLTDYELRAFNANPYDLILSGNSRKFFLPSAGGGGATLIVQDLTQGHSLGVPSLTEHAAITVQALSQAQSLEAPSLTQHNLLAVDALAQAHTIGSPSLVQHNVLAVDALAQAQTIENISLTQHGVLVVQGMAQDQTIGAPSLTQHNILAVDALTQAQTIENVVLAIAGVLAVADVTQAQTIGAPSLTQHNLLAVDALTQSQTLEAASLTQHYALAVQAIMQAHSLSNVTLTPLGMQLLVNDLTQAQLLDAPALTQHNVLVVQGMTQAQILQACTLGGLVIGSLEGTIVAYALIDGDLVAYTALAGTAATVH